MRTAEIASEANRRFDEQLDQWRRRLAVPIEMPSVDPSFLDAIATQAAEIPALVEDLAVSFDNCIAEQTAWRGRVFRGEERFSKAVDAEYRWRLSDYGHVADQYRGKVEFFARHLRNNPLDLDASARKLEEVAAGAKREFLRWESPALAPSPALRTHSLSKAEAAKFRAVFDKSRTVAVD